MARLRRVSRADPVDAAATGAANLVQHQDEVALHVADDVVVERGREVDQREADVDDEQDDVGHLGDAPQLTPHFEVMLKEAQPLDGIPVVDGLEPLAEHGGFLALHLRLALAVPPRRPLGDVDDRIGPVKVGQLDLKGLLQPRRQARNADGTVRSAARTGRCTWVCFRTDGARCRYGLRLSAMRFSITSLGSFSKTDRSLQRDARSGRGTRSLVIWRHGSSRGHRFGGRGALERGGQVGLLAAVCRPRIAAPLLHGGRGIVSNLLVRRAAEVVVMVRPAAPRRRKVAAGCTAAPET